jgi:hypothetical protein
MSFIGLGRDLLPFDSCRWGPCAMSLGKNVWEFSQYERAKIRAFNPVA